VAGEVVVVGDEVEGIEVGARVLAPTSPGGLAERVAVDAARVVLGAASTEAKLVGSFDRRPPRESRERNRDLRNR